MSFWDNRNREYADADEDDDLFCHQQDQDDLAVFELSSSSNYVTGFGSYDDDNDDDSDVVVIDPTPNELAEKFVSENYDSKPHSSEQQQQLKGYSKKLVPPTHHNNFTTQDQPHKKRNYLSSERTKDCSGVVNVQKQRKLKQSLEGSKASEPIHIDDDSDDDYAPEYGHKSSEVVDKKSANSNSDATMKHKFGATGKDMGSKLNTKSASFDGTTTIGGKQLMPMNRGRKRSRDAIEGKRMRTIGTFQPSNQTGGGVSNKQKRPEEHSKYHDEGTNTNKNGAQKNEYKKVSKYERRGQKPEKSMKQAKTTSVSEFDTAAMMRSKMRFTGIACSNASPKLVLEHFYTTSHFGNSQTKLRPVDSKQFLTWASCDVKVETTKGSSRKQMKEKGHKLLYTSLYMCPHSGEVFFAGPEYRSLRKTFYSSSKPDDCDDYDSNFFWYKSVQMAEQAAAARAWDCFLLREGGNLRDFCLGGSKPYHEGEGPGWPRRNQFPAWIQSRLWSNGSPYRLLNNEEKRVDGNQRNITASNDGELLAGEIDSSNTKRDSESKGNALDMHLVRPIDGKRQETEPIKVGVDESTGSRKPPFEVTDLTGEDDDDDEDNDAFFESSKCRHKSLSSLGEIEKKLRSGTDTRMPISPNESSVVVECGNNAVEQSEQPLSPMSDEGTSSLQETNQLQGMMPRETEGNFQLKVDAFEQKPLLPMENITDLKPGIRIASATSMEEGADPTNDVGRNESVIDLTSTNGMKKKRIVYLEEDYAEHETHAHLSSGERNTEDDVPLISLKRRIGMNSTEDETILANNAERQKSKRKESLDSNSSKIPSVTKESSLSVALEMQYSESDIRKKGEKIESFLQAVHGFLPDNIDPTKQHRDLKNVKGIECIELDNDSLGERTRKHENNIGSRSKSTGRVAAKSNCRTNTKPRFKPQKNSKIKKSEPSTTTENESLSSERSQECPTNKTDPDFKCSSDSGGKPISKSNPFQNETADKPESEPDSRREYRFIFHKSSFKPTDRYSIGMTFADAEKEQERLFQRAAERLRTHAAFRVESQFDGPKKPSTRGTITFSTLVHDVHLQYSEHWKFRNCYSRLGLPRHASDAMIKSQYRRLARIYHPDRNIGKPDTKHKFQAVTEAYNSLMSAG